MLPRALLLAALVATGCGSDDSPSPSDMQVANDVGICLAIACVGSCPPPDTHCVSTGPGEMYGGCTYGNSTCGTHLTGDCNFATQCLGPKLLGKLFVADPEGGCGIDRISCPNGCVDPRADGGAGPEAHCL